MEVFFSHFQVEQVIHIKNLSPYSENDYNGCVQNSLGTENESKSHF